MSNTTKMRDALVFVGRFQPFHNGHKAVIDAALKQAKQVVVVVGSSFAARSIRNPFTFQERKAMIDAVYKDEVVSWDAGSLKGFATSPRVLVVPVSDYPYDDNKWVNAVQKVVDETLGPHFNDVGLIGHSKDHTSYYLNIFPKWKNHVEVPNVDGINATDIRKSLFDSTDYEEYDSIREVMPSQSHWEMKRIISNNSNTGGAWGKLLVEYQMIKKYKEAWKAAPFPPTFMTVDAVVVQSGHILLVKRGDMPGKNLQALPGGFLNQEETMLDGCIRELKEETKIKVPVPVLKGSIKASKTFDAPNRSQRGRTITQAYFIDLGVGDLPKVKGSDDAADAYWLPFSKLRQEEFFEDHAHIVDYFVPFL